MERDESALRHFEAGRFRQASQSIKGKSADPYFALELAYFLGDSAKVRAEARRLLTGKQTKPALRARVLRILASQHRDEGLFDQALKAGRAAVELLDKSDAKELVLTYTGVLESECDTAPFEVSRPTALQTRRAALRSGDPTVLAIVHETFGRLEARVGNLDRALRHFAIARSHLDDTPNLWIQAAIEVDESSTRCLLSDIPAALDHAKRGAIAADESGWAKGMAAAALNCAYFSLLLGLTADAEEYLALADRQRFTSPSYQFALVETRAQLALLRGEHEFAEQLLAEHRDLLERVFSWYRLSAAETEVRLLTRMGRWKDAVKRADRALTAARDHDMNTFVPVLQFRRALAAHRGGGKVGLADLTSLNHQRSWPLATTATFWMLRGALTHNTDTALAYSGRAVRLLEAAGDQSAASEARELSRQNVALENSPPTLESAAALFELAGHPLVLARETLAVIAGAGCARAAAIVARGPRDVRVLEMRDWDERGALAAARKADEGDLIDCGTHRDERVQIVARPHDDLDRRCTWMAVRTLVATAVTLDRYRRDEKQRAALWPTESLDGHPDALWVSEQSIELLRVARRIALTPLTVLLTGESGTGKEMMARAIHAASERGSKRFLGFNCTAVPREMFESQLFGYRKGAFTGAETTFGGIIRAAEGGTLFLDEIADVPRDVQPKLLRFLETHEIHPLGEPHPIEVDVRVIAATNVDLERLVAEGRFREDLFYRLNVVRLRLPPLRERREEVPSLVEHYVRKYGIQQKKGRLTISDEALEYLLLYPWPGNIRQLANEVNRMVAMAEPDAALTAAHLSAEIQATRKTVAASAAPSSELRISLDQPLAAAVEFLERTMVESALNRTNGRLEEAARILGISRKGLFLKRRRWGLSTAED